MKRILIAILAVLMIAGMMAGCTPKLKELEDVLDDVNEEVEKMKELEQAIEDGKIEEGEIPVIGGELEVGEAEGTREVNGDIKQMLLYNDTRVDVDESDALMFESSASYDELKDYYKDLLKGTAMYSLTSMGDQGAMITGTISERGMSIVLEPLDSSIRVTVQIDA